MSRQQMTHLELMAALDHAHKALYNRGYEPLQVVVDTKNSGVPRSYKAGVVSAGAGFDWTAGLFILHTKEPLVVARILEEPIDDYARKRLESIKEQHSKLGFKYIEKVRERAWLEGYREGIRAHVTSCGGKLEADD